MGLYDNNFIAWDTASTTAKLHQTGVEDVHLACKRLMTWQGTFCCKALVDINLDQPALDRQVYPFSVCSHNTRDHLTHKPRLCPSSDDDSSRPAGYRNPWESLLWRSTAYKGAWFCLGLKFTSRQNILENQIYSKSLCLNPQSSSISFQLITLHTRLILSMRPPSRLMIQSCHQKLVSKRPDDQAPAPPQVQQCHQEVPLVKGFQSFRRSPS